jgi:hypothetical protein
MSFTERDPGYERAELNELGIRFCSTRVGSTTMVDEGWFGRLLLIVGMFGAGYLLLVVAPMVVRRLRTGRWRHFDLFPPTGWAGIGSFVGGGLVAAGIAVGGFLHGVLALLGFLVMVCGFVLNELRPRRAKDVTPRR